MAGSLVPDWLETADRGAPWETLTVCVAGLGVSGFAAADALLRLGSSVIVVDTREGGLVAERAQVLDLLGADVRLGESSSTVLPKAVQLVVTSPGWWPTAPLLMAAEAAGVPVWGRSSWPGGCGRSSTPRHGWS